MHYQAMNVRVGTEKDLENKNYIFEPKLDGFRALCFINTKVQFISRNNIDLTLHYPELQTIKKLIKARTCILDGEIVACDKEGIPQFELLQAGNPASYWAFDILMKNGKNLMNLTLLERKKILDSTLIAHKNIKKVFFTTHGKALWNEMLKRHGEGVIAKEITGIYHSGLRSNTWLKIKIDNTLDCVIVGYGTKKRQLSALGLALYDSDKKLHYIGKVGTGFSQERIIELLKLLEPLAINYNPTSTSDIKNLHFVKPQLTCEVKYEELTRHKRVRQASFVRLRPNKKPLQCTFKSQIS
jgi:DNA ligase D-like protein (predicted ligase)